MSEAGMEGKHMWLGNRLAVSPTCWNMLFNGDNGSFDEDVLRQLGRE